MSNRIQKRQSTFTQVSNDFLRDNNISFKAKGLFCYMFSMNENWNFTIKSIATQQKDGESSIISSLKELKEYGYITYQKHSDGSGTYFLDDEPKLEKPSVENPNLGKPTPIKKKQLDKNKNTYTSDFEKIWNWYKEQSNRSIGDKKRANQTYLKQLKNMEDIEIRRAMFNYVTDCNKRNTFMKDLSTFLNGDMESYINMKSTTQQQKREEVLV